LADRLDSQRGVKVFVFSTAAFPFKSMHNALRARLVERGFDVVGEFQCKGFMSHSFTKHFFGGVCKGRPNEKDLNKAREFAVQLVA
jgi:flavodoxin